jgi:hypothetical protein
MEAKKVIAGRSIVVPCDNAALGNADWLLDVLPKLVEKGLRLDDGTTFQFGWAPLMLRARGADLVVHEPDFDDVARGWRADATTTLVVQAEMMGLARSVKAAPIVVPTYQQIVFVDVAAWRSPGVTMSRIRLQNPKDSGWLVVPEGMDSSHTEEARVWELVKKKRHWLPPMALPRGYTVHLEGTKIAAIGTPPGRTLY